MLATTTEARTSESWTCAPCTQGDHFTCDGELGGLRAFLRREPEPARYCTCWKMDAAHLGCLHRGHYGGASNDYDSLAAYDADNQRRQDIQEQLEDEQRGERPPVRSEER